MSTLQTINSSDAISTWPSKLNANFTALNTDKQENITLTTTGTSWPATLVGATLNIPQYSGGAGATTLDWLTDVTISSPTNWQALIYESASTQWKNQALPWGWDMLKSTYDTDNDGVVDYSSGTSSTVRNQTGGILYKWTLVYISGGTWWLPLVSKWKADAESTSAGTFWVMFTDLANNSNGTVVKSGRLASIDLRTTATNPITSTALADGDTIYLDPTTAGYITNVKPVAPNHMVYVGKVITAWNNGILDINIRNGYEIDELHDVLITSKTDLDLLSYESSTNLWKNKSITTLNIATNSTTSTHIAQQIELWHASDTTITRVSAGKIAVDGINIGTEWILQNSQSSAYTLVLTDAGKHIYHPSADTTARIWTIPANSSVAFPIGTAITFINDSSAGTITISITTDTLVLAGTGATGSRTLSANWIATATKITSTRWIISWNWLS